MINFKQSFHWYECQNGEPKGMHDADLRVARKLNLYPSITTVDKDQFTNPGLDRYKANQLAMAAYEYPRMEHETKETYCQRIYEKSLEHSIEAADFGKELHDAIEEYPQMPLNAELAPYLERFGNWYASNVESVLHREKILVDHELGLAGRCDFIGISKRTGRLIMPDWKSQDVKKSAKGKKTPAYYDSWKRQLSFYSVAYAKEMGLFPNEIIDTSSVVIDSNEPDDPFEQPWEILDIKSAYEDVCIAAYKYFKQRDYWPHKSQIPTIKLWCQQPN